MHIIQVILASYTYLNYTDKNLHILYINKKFIKNKAFSLLELSAVLVIIGIIISISFSVYNRDNDSIKKEITTRKLNHIDAALTAFILSNKRAPCPARGALGYSDPNYAIEDCNSFDLIYSGNSNPFYNSGTTYSFTNVMGVVPSETLGLPKDYVLDGWNNKISYVIAPSFTTFNTNYSFFDKGIAETRNYNGKSYTSQINSYDNIITRVYTGADGYNFDSLYAVFSHGASGQIAWPKEGVARNADGSKYNLFSDPTWNQPIYAPGENCDCIIRSKTAQQFYVETGKMISVACLQFLQFNNSNTLQSFCTHNNVYNTTCANNILAISRRLKPICLIN